MQKVETFTGGQLETNASFLEAPGGFLCFDAPEGTAEELRRKKVNVSALILTHGHFDHVWEAAAIQDEHKCPVWIHQADAFMVQDTSVFRSFGISPDLPKVKDVEVLPVPIKGSADWSCAGIDFKLFHIPGHSPGSVAFYLPAGGIIIGGDILFREGVGRWDLPGGNRRDLIAGIREYLLPLPEDTVVYPGHGPETTIGFEKESNPYLD